MERLYTSITNELGNNNYLQTGRTGEREDYMRENWVCQVKCVSSFLHIFPQPSAV